MSDRRRLRLISTALSWVVTAALVGYILATTDFPTFFKAVGHADIPSFLALAIAFNLGHLALDSVGVGLLLDRTGLGIPLRRLIPIRAASYLLGFINYNLAFVLIAAAAGRDRNVRWQSLVSPFLALNVIDLFVMGSVLLAGLSGGNVEVPGAYAPLMAAGIVSVALLVVMTVLSRLRRSGRPGFISGFFDTFRALDPRSLMLILGLRFLFLLTDATGDLLMLRTFNLDIPVAVFARFFPVDSFACVLPITVAGIGPTLVLMRIFFAPYVPAAQGSLASIDAFSVSATTLLMLIRTGLALVCMPMITKLWKQIGKRDAGRLAETDQTAGP